MLSVQLHQNVSFSTVWFIDACVRKNECVWEDCIVLTVCARRAIDRSANRRSGGDKDDAQQDSDWQRLPSSRSFSSKELFQKRNYCHASPGNQRWKWCADSEKNKKLLVRFGAESLTTQCAGGIIRPALMSLISARLEMFGWSNVISVMLNVNYKINPLECKCIYSATSNTTRYEERSPPRPLIAVPNVTAHPSTASVPITVLLYNGPLFCGF